MNKRVVVGLGFGDEGKGHVVNWLASEGRSPIVVRHSGGHQVGHCVRLGDGEKHIFSNFGSATLKGVPTHWRAKTVDPVGIVNEYELLKQYNPKLYIDPMTPVTTPYEKALNRIKDLHHKHGSVGVGFGATIQREEDNYHLYFKDLFYENILKNKLNLIKEHYENKLRPGHYVSIEEMDNFLEACEKATLIVSNSEVLKYHDVEIYEGAQGLLLDMDYGFFPHVTRSQLGTQHLPELDDDTDYYLVTRGYQTRHGNGPMCDEEFSPNNPDETNSNESFQGEFRTSILDLDALHYAITIDPKIRDSQYKNLVITCLDQMETYSLMWRGKRMDFKDERAFLQSIICRLPKMDNYYVSHGPTEDDIKKYTIPERVGCPQYMETALLSVAMTGLDKLNLHTNLKI